MPAIQTLVTLAAATSTPNTVTGSAFEYSRGRSLLSLGVTQSAAGLLATIQSGADIILEESPPFVLAGFPVVPDHMYYNDVMEAMDRLRVAVRNPTAGPLDVRTLALITAIA